MRTASTTKGSLLLLLTLFGCEKTEETYVLGTSSIPPSWGTFQIISALNTPLQGVPAVAMDASGNAVAVWAQEDTPTPPNPSGPSSIYASRMKRGVWSPPRLLESDTNSLDEPKVALNPSGTAVAIWKTAEYIYACRMKPDGQWESPQRIDTDNETKYSAQIAIDAEGRALAVWSLSNAIHYNRMDSDGTWGTADVLISSSNPIQYLKMAMNSSGVAFAAWSQSDGIVFNIRACRFAGAIWAPPQTIEDLSHNCAVHDIAVDEQGNAIVVWEDDPDRILYACRWTGGSWETPTPIGDYDSDSVRAAMTGDGNAVVVWVQDAALFNHLLARRLVSGSWQPLEFLEHEDGGYASFPSVASDGRGNIVVAWVQDLSSGGPRIFSKLFVGGAWGLEGPIENQIIPVGNPSVAMSADGTAAAVWEQGTAIGANCYR